MQWSIAWHSRHSFAERHAIILGMAFITAVIVTINVILHKADWESFQNILENYRPMSQITSEAKLNVASDSIISKILQAAAESIPVSKGKADERTTGIPTQKSGSPNN